LSFGQAAEVYTVLTIGDGLVGQIPALIISTAAGVVVSRVANDQDVSQQMLGALFSNLNVLFITGGILGLMGLIPNMPHVAFLSLSILLSALGWSMLQKQKKELAAAAVEPAQKQAAVEAAAAEATW